MRRQRRQRRRMRRPMYSKIKKHIGALGLLALIVPFAVGAFAAEDAAQKFVEGVEETATGWIEAPKEIAETTEKENIIEGVTVGAVEGAGEAVVKTTGGVVKVATAPIAPIYAGDEEEKE